MKRKIIILLFIMFSCLLSNAQIEGYWKGTLDTGLMQIESAFNITKHDNHLKATLDIPTQGVYDMNTDTCIFSADTLLIEMKNIGASYKGILTNDSIHGSLTQRGEKINLLLTKGIKQAPQRRPQDPIEPYPYKTEEINFDSQSDNVSLAGTLTLPCGEGPFPAAILVSGSGQQNRDEEIMNHRPFLVIADHLARQGIATLRYDDRGFGQSKGNADNATTADNADDTESALKYLLTRDEIDHSMIGIIGHSEGGLIAFMVAARTTDIAFVISLAGPSAKGKSVLIQQQQDIFRAQGMTEQAINFYTATPDSLFNIIDKSRDTQDAQRAMLDYLTSMGMTEEAAFNEIKPLLSPWMHYFIKHDPAQNISNTHCPALVLNGTKDVQVNYKQNLSIYKDIKKKHHKKNIHIVAMKGLNHLFQHCDTGLPYEYATIEETISPKVLFTVSDFIIKQAKKQTPHCISK